MRWRRGPIASSREPGPPRGDSLLFAHGHLLRMLGARWIGAPPTSGQHLLLSTAAVCVLGWERETPALARWNDTSHLAGLASPDRQAVSGRLTAWLRRKRPTL